MRVAIVNPTNGGLSGGYRKYLVELVPRLATDPRVEALATWVPPQLRGELAAELADARTWPEGDHRLGFRALRRDVRAWDPDVLFVPTARWIDAVDVPTVVMVRNMEPFVVPPGMNEPIAALKNVARLRAARRACERATRVIAVSEHVREVITARWRLPAYKVATVYHGVDAPRASRAPTALAALDGAPFLLTAGSIRPARGLEDLIGALGALRARGRRVPIVVAGAADPDARRYAVEMRALADRLGVADDVTWAGHLSAPELAWGFARCAAFVMTSRAEACPNTALEAMAHGAVCVSTDGPPMPEFFADGAVYYRRGDAASLATRLEELRAASSAELDALRHRARTRAADFPWSVAARRTVDELATAAGVSTPARVAAEAV
jgi:glycosyltransferase involved in cell wall biosynthesis